MSSKPAAGVGATGGRATHLPTNHPEMTMTGPDRPFRDEPTEVLQAALDLASAHAQQAARFRPAQPGDALPSVVGLFRNELQHRKGQRP